MSTRVFLRQQAGFLSFGFLSFGLGNLGQTFFIALYNDAMRAAFELSHSDFGAIYALVTLASATLFFFTGKYVDSWSLRRFALFVMFGLFGACTAMFMSHSFIILIFALFFLRYFGQGLSSHMAMTSISRAYTKHRGVAVSVSQLGMPVGESFMPLMAISLIALLGWRESWGVYALIILLFWTPLIVWLTGFEPPQRVEQEAGRPADRRAVLRDRRFFAIMPLYIAPAFLLTGMFFNHAALAASRDWSMELIAQGFGVYAIFKIMTSLVAGPLVDRFTARRLQPFTGIPLLLGFGVLALPEVFEGPSAVYLYLAFCGINLGMTAPVSGGLWPELFGTAHLGAIRSMTGPVIILSTSVAPLIFGVFIDGGFAFSIIARLAIIYVLMAMGLALIWGRHRAEFEGGREAT